MKEIKRKSIIRKIKNEQKKRLNNSLTQLNKIEKKRESISELEKQANDILEMIKQNPKEYDKLIKSFREVYTKLNELEKKYNKMNILAIKQNIVEYQIDALGKKYMEDYIDEENCDHEYWIYLGSFKQEVTIDCDGDEKIYYRHVVDENDKDFVANEYGCIECGKTKFVKQYKKDYRNFEKTHNVLKRKDQSSYFEYGKDYFDEYNLYKKYKEMYQSFLFEYSSFLAFERTKSEFLKEEYKDSMNNLNNKLLECKMKKESLKEQKEALKEAQKKITRKE